MSIDIDLPVDDQAFVRFKTTAVDTFGNFSEDYADDYFILGDPFGDYNVNDLEDMVIVDWGWGDYELIYISNAALDFLEIGDVIHVVDEHGIIVQGCDYEPDEINGTVSVAQDIYEADRNVVLYSSESVDFCEEGGDRFPGYVEWNPISYLFHDVSADEYFTMEADYQFGYGYFGAPNGMEGGHNFLIVLYDQSSGEVYTYPQWFEGWTNTNGAPMPGYDDHTVVYDFSSSPNG
ncbi:MAG: hypothetical protein QF551_00490, partial [Candidatus Marinimicrobia bacterium]|nr:hypothetical protein [Candidatus Neomarinimicrobiota bacterium]